MPLEDDVEDLLGILTEEAAEVIVAASKIHRFGLESKHPLRSATNREELTEELGDFLCCIDLLCKKRVVSRYEIELAAKRKLKKLEQYSPHVLQERIESIYDWE